MSKKVKSNHSVKIAWIGVIGLLIAAVITGFFQYFKPFINSSAPSTNKGISAGHDINIGDNSSIITGSGNITKNDKKP